MGRNQFSDIPIRDRLLNGSEAITESGCWIWMQTIDYNGYGQMSIDDKTRLVHRVSYEEFVGQIPRGKEIDHKCLVKCCINPNHLRVVSCATNIRESRSTMKLDWTKVLDIRLRCSRGESQTSVARLYGVRPDHISRIMSREVWRDN